MNITDVCGHTWNGGQCCFSFENDASFLEDVIDATLLFLENLGFTQSANASIFLFGFSAGAVMSHRMACSQSGKISAIAAVSGTLNFPGNFVFVYVSLYLSLSPAMQEF